MSREGLSAMKGEIFMANWREVVEKTQEFYEWSVETADVMSQWEPIQWAAFFGVIALAAGTYYYVWLCYFYPTVPVAKITKKCFMEVSKEVEGVTTVMGRIEIGLYGDDCPLTVENFRQLCTGEAIRKKTGLPLCYKDSWFHTVRAPFQIQGGDTLYADGSSGEGIYGKKMEDEKSGKKLMHHKKGIVGMNKLARGERGNSGNGLSNGSQFVIFTERAQWLDGLEVVFGEVTSGYEEVVQKMVDMGSPYGNTTENFKEVRLFVSDCGEVPFVPADTASGLPEAETKKLQ